jgi:dolichol-phosphate mannosyltransferase
MGVLAAMFHLLHFSYLAATLVGVEAAVLHNFLWHQRWTWKERPSGSLRDRWNRLLRFQASNGVVSLAGNTLFMGILVGTLHLPVMVAAFFSVILCSAINFLFSDQWVFQVSRDEV